MFTPDYIISELMFDVKTVFLVYVWIHLIMLIAVSFVVRQLHYYPLQFVTIS